MNYKSDSQKNKLPNLLLNNQIQETDIKFQNWVSTTIDSNVKNTQPRNQNINVSDIWNFNWVLMTPILVESTIVASYYSWKILFGNINYKWISQFKPQLFFKNGINGEGDSSLFKVVGSSYHREFIGWEITDLESNPLSDIKIVSLVVSIMFYATSYPETIIIPPFYTKLLIHFNSSANRD